MEELRITWEEVDELTKQLLATIAPSNRLHYRFEHLAGISRGGLVPLSILANHLRIRQPNIGIVHAQSYQGINQQESVSLLIEPRTAELLNQPDTLVIDDIYDSGATYRRLQESFPKPTYAALYRRNGSPDFPNLIWAKNVPKSTWLVFPWEV